MEEIKPMRPLAPLYRPGERFELTAAGLEEWYRSESFRRVSDFFHLYPSRSVFNSNGRSLLYHLIVMQRPERVLEIGTMYAGTTEVMARAVWEAGKGRVDTIDPFGADRCPPLIAEFPRELQERITFSPASSAMHFNEGIERGWTYDLVLVDGNHELEYAAFDLDCAARLLRPGGFVVMDNIEQVGPRFATRQFLERHPEWIDVAGVVGRMDEADPFGDPPASFPDTKNYLLQAPPYYAFNSVPRSFGNQRCDRGEVDGVEITLSGSARGVLHMQTFVRTFGMVHPEELSSFCRVDIDAKAGETMRIPLMTPLRTAYPATDLDRRIEIILAFVGDRELLLKSPPLPYPAKYF
jgi:predicted O-methyltransferase YrrM